MGTIMNTTTPLSFNSIDFETPDIKPTMPVPGLRLLCQHCQRPILISDHVYLDVANKRASWKGVDIGLTTGKKFLKLDPEFKCIANFISFGYRWVV
jgi:hypothetical protein